MRAIAESSLTNAYVDTNLRVKLAGALVSMLILAGCGTTKVEYRYTQVPEPPRIERPELESVNIDSSMDAGTIIQKFRTDIKRLQSTILEYEKALDVYRKKDSK